MYSSYSANFLYKKWFYLAISQVKDTVFLSETFIGNVLDASNES